MPRSVGVLNAPSVHAPIAGFFLESGRSRASAAPASMVDGVAVESGTSVAAAEGE